MLHGSVAHEAKSQRSPLLTPSQLGTLASECPAPPASRLGTSSVAMCKEQYFKELG